MVARPIGDAHAFSANGASATMGTSIVHGQTMLLQLLFSCVLQTRPSSLHAWGLVSWVECRFLGRLGALALGSVAATCPCCRFFSLS